MSERLTVEGIRSGRAELLAELRRRQGVLRDFVCGAARRYHTGFYLFGRPGTAKTHTVRRVLEEEVREPYSYNRGHITPMGLFELLGEYRDDVIVLDDTAYILRSETALQMLLAALEQPRAGESGGRVSYRRLGERQDVWFRGSVIAISNRELHDDELLDAFRSRVNVLNYDPSDAQLGALMLDAAARGWPAGAAKPAVPPEAATEVAEHVVAELLRLGCRFDLRLLFNKALPSYQQWHDSEADSHWKDLVTATIEEHLVRVAHDAGPRTREERLEEERSIVRDIVRQHDGRDEQLRAWRERTAKSERAFYRRKAELEL